MDNFMLLGLFNTIAKAIGKAVASIVTVIVEPILNSIIPLITNFLLGIFTALLPSVVTLGRAIGMLIFNLVVSIVETILDTTVGKDKMIDVTINFASKSYSVIVNNEITKMLAWTPINYFNRGSSDVNTSILNPYFMSIKLMKEGIMPSAMTIFALIVMVELFQITVRTEGMRNSGFESPFKLMLKVAICKILLDNTQMVLEAIFNFATDIFNKLYSIGKEVDLSQADWGPIKELLRNFDWLTLIMLWAQMGLQLLLVWLVMLIVPFIVFGRVMEMYIMITLAPIPFATFASQEFSQIGKNFLKQFIGLSLKVVVMYVIILIFCLMITVVTFDVGNVASLEALRGLIIGVLPNYWAAIGIFFAEIGIKPVIFSIMLLMTLLGADKYTKQITGAWY
jgi:hypothetical protein